MGSVCNAKTKRVHAKSIFFGDRRSDDAETFTAKMKRKIDTWKGRMIYGMRLGIVEPVFGNLSHNLGKLYRYGSGFA